MYTLEEKERLARTNDMGAEAAAIRLRAAIKVTGLSQKDFAASVGVGKTAINNALAGLAHPSRETLKLLYRAHRIDFNFMLNGSFSGLPSDVQDALFPALEAATSEWDRREGSGQGRDEPKDGRQADKFGS